MSSSTAAWLTYLNVQLNRYLPLPFVIFGTIGLTLNILIFTRRSLFHNSCVQYLLCNTLSNFIVLYWVIVTRILSDGYGNDLSLRSDAFCRIRYFLTYFSRTLSTWSIVLACADRWFSSVQAKNRFNTVSLARRVILITCLACFLCYIHVLFLFGIQINPVSSAISCYARTGLYRILSDVQYLLFYAVGPPVLMLFFGLLTLRNLRRTRRVVQPQIQHAHQSTGRRDAQLLVMLLFQIVIIIVFTLPFAIQKLIDTFSLQTQQTPEQKAQYNLLTGTLRLISYGSHALGFFFYTLAARIFRVELLRVINTLYRSLTGKNLFQSTRSVVTQGMTMMRHDMEANHTVEVMKEWNAEGRIHSHSTQIPLICANGNTNPAINISEALPLIGKFAWTTLICVDAWLTEETRTDSELYFVVALIPFPSYLFLFSWHTSSLSFRSSLSCPSSPAHGPCCRHWYRKKKIYIYRHYSKHCTRIQVTVLV